MKTMLATIGLAAAVISAPAGAQEQRGGWMQRDQVRADAQQRADRMFQMLDVNKDGTATKAEAQQALEQLQAARGDGGEGRGAGRIQRMINLAFGSGQSITLQQFEAQALARFDRMDLDHNGTVTAAERQQARANGQSKDAAPAASPAPPPPAGSAKLQ